MNDLPYMPNALDGKLLGIVLLHFENTWELYIESMLLEKIFPKRFTYARKQCLDFVTYLNVNVSS